jgi:hypothetical protein
VFNVDDAKEGKSEMKSRIWIIAIVALFSIGVLGGETKAQDGVKAGILRCNVGSGWGFVFGSSKELKCVYSPGGERYAGEIQKYGVDIGYTQSGVIVWTVFAPTKELNAGALTGTYVGATAEVSLGMGLGANVLVGGGNSIALQPLSISGQEGLNVAGGIGAITLKAVK